MPVDHDMAEAWTAGYLAGDCDAPANLNPYTGKNKVQAVAWADGLADAQFKKYVGKETFTQGEKLRLIFDWAFMVCILVFCVWYFFTEII